ncbi:MAG: DUF302 domain-containing protein [Alphaproteobacteria bacterium]|nr:DUF302 domain-containing protein [Alphaproteobacteria bacterium]
MGLRLTGLAMLFVLMFGSADPLQAENPTPYSGTQVIETGKPFLPYVEALTASVKSNNFGIIGLACATCAIKAKFGEEIPGNRVFLIFRPDFARRMLAASTAAGIEAPIRLYVTETPEGSATVTYRLPSHVFGAYEVAALTEMGEELDRLVAQVLADAVAGS